MIANQTGNYNDDATYPGTKETLHWPFDDPADATGTDDEKMVFFRRVRDEIKKKIQNYFRIENNGEIK